MNTDAPGAPYGELAGFWIRFFSDLLDALFLGVVGFVLTWALRAWFLRLGERGAMVGLFISLAYAGVLQSRLGGGQTLAKRLLNLRVVRLDGSLLSLDRSLLRYVVVNFMVYQSAVALALVTVLPLLPIQWVEALFGTVALVLFLGCVVVVPFHPLKRGLHDLVAGTIVVRGGVPEPGFLAARANPVRDRGILIGAGAMVVVSLIFAVVLSRRPLAVPGGITDASSLVGELPIQNASIIDAVEFHDGVRTRSILVAGFLLPPPDRDEPDLGRAHEAITRALRARIPADSGVAKIGTSLRTGSNVGIYRQYASQVRLEPLVAVVQ